ncbi:MAG: trehalase [Acidobacteria bacterium]|nr:trehalase [Acidobacteriota bacterium]
MKPCVAPLLTLHSAQRQRKRAIAILLFLALIPSADKALPTDSASDRLAPIREYIQGAWQTLTRSTTECNSIVDPKIASAAVLYLPADFAAPATVDKLSEDCKVEIKHLPTVIHQPGEVDPQAIFPPGLLFLENRYVVPGGRFNEMYGWDSYFIILGLIEDGKIELAQGMVDNFLFEIAHYGTVLNANRTYFLSRSQPPFLTSMILAVYEAQRAARQEAPNWLERAYAYADGDYQMWNRRPHLAGETGLARYFDFGQGPVAEGLQDEAGEYRAAARYFLSHPETADHDLVELTEGGQNPDAIGFPFTLQLCEARQSANTCDPLRILSLTRDYYKGDRSMRESGFDVSFRFGPYGARTHHYAPVCLNSLLYKTEADMARMSLMLGKRREAKLWQERARERRARINKYLWDERRREFLDYNFETQKLSDYEYVTMFYPLWAGLASPEQARAVEKKVSVFEQPGGLVMSRSASGAQWDYPYGWAPTTMLAIDGLRRYGFNADADRLSYKFLSMLLENFGRDGTLREKYNVATRSSETNVTAGYHMNVVGFGWTNAVFEKLLAQMSSEWRSKLQSDAKLAP